MKANGPHTCQHVLHHRDEAAFDKTGRFRPEGHSYATPEENAAVPSCAMCRYPMSPWLWNNAAFVRPTRRRTA
jgi:hypothetical protein